MWTFSWLTVSVTGFNAYPAENYIKCLHWRSHFPPTDSRGAWEELKLGIEESSGTHWLRILRILSVDTGNCFSTLLQGQPTDSWIIGNTNEGGGVHCDYDSGDGCQLEISTFTFIFTQLRTELRFYLFICLLVFNVGKGSWLSAHTASSWWTLLKFSQGSPGFPSLLVTTSRDKCPKGR